MNPTELTTWVTFAHHANAALTADALPKVPLSLHLQCQNGIFGHTSS